MAQEATKLTPRIAAPARTFYLIKRLQTETHLLMEEALREFELTPTLYLALSLIRQHSDLSSAELARRLRTAPQSANELIATLDRKRLVVRRTADGNRRVLRISISAEGSDMLQKCDTVMDRLEAKILGQVDDAALKNFRQMTRALADRMQEHRGAAGR
jgi:DNA-binding MarR family transcriptional regulator